MKRAVLILVVLAAACALAFGKGQGEKAAASAPKEIKVWEGLWNNTAVSATTLADTPLYKDVQKRTGVKVTFIHPPQGQENESFNLMIASNELPDMIYRNWLTAYPGGPEKAISDKVIIKLNDVFAGKAPNLMARYAKNPDWLKGAKTDNGTLYAFPFIRGHEDLMVFQGPQVRKDWLDQLGLARPETLAEWESVLKAVKQGGKAAYPLTFTRLGVDRSSVSSADGVFIQPFGVTWAFFKDDGGRVHFGPYENAYRDFLALFKDWFDKGLVDPEFISNELKTFDAKVLNGQAFAWIANTGNGIGSYLDAMRGKGGTFDIVPVKYPVIKKGDVPFCGQRDNPVRGDGLAISTQARNPDLCAQWADFAYGDEGHLLFNFGLEGESYNWVTNYPGFEGVRFAQYTDLVMKNPAGKTMAQMGGLYTRSFYNGAMVQDRQYIYQYANRPAQREALSLWAITGAIKHRLPAVSATPKESQELAVIMAEVNTYRDEMFVKFITGQEPMANFAAYQAQLKKMGIDQAIAIQQAMLERYDKR